MAARVVSKNLFSFRLAGELDSDITEELKRATPSFDYTHTNAMSDQQFAAELVKYMDDKASCINTAAQAHCC